MVPWWLLVVAGWAGAALGILVASMLWAADNHVVVQQAPPWVDQLRVPLLDVPDSVGLYLVCNSCLQLVRYDGPSHFMPHGGWDHLDPNLSGDHPARPYLQAEVRVDQGPAL